MKLTEDQWEEIYRVTDPAPVQEGAQIAVREMRRILATGDGEIDRDDLIQFLSFLYMNDTNRDRVIAALTEIRFKVAA